VGTIFFTTSIVFGTLAKLLSLDISKAYDKIDWLYLKEVMLKMGFDSKWVRWIMMCVETVDYSVIVNNELVGPIIPGRV